MALRLTRPDSVESAVAEFDLLGRNDFLKKYGFGRAREYFLLANGRLYDSKAICGAAFGIENPNDGPLRPADFSGGESTVAQQLESLGFTVVRGGGVTDPDPKPLVLEESRNPTASSAQRNPAWERDELILALTSPHI